MSKEDKGIQSLDQRIAALVPDIDGQLQTELQQLLGTLRNEGYIPGVIVGASRLVEGQRGVLGRVASIHQYKLKVYNLEKQIEELREKGILPSEIASDLHWIRVRANRARHNIERLTLTVYDAETALNFVLRLIEWFYCKCERGQGLPTIYDPQQLALAALRQPSEEWPAPSLWRHAPEKSTTVFPDLAERLVQMLERGSDLVVLAGAPGMGKSRVAAVLFEPGCGSSSLPVWFVGNSVEELLESIGAVRRKPPTQKLCIVLDEEHQHPVRDEQFFIEFFQSGARQALRGQHTVVLVVRTSTYETLTAQNFLVRADTIHIVSDEHRLERYESWGLDRPLSAEEKKWIQAIASDEEGNLISFLVDRVCIPDLKRGRSLEDERFGDQRSILDTVYQGLVAPQSEENRQLMEALCIAGQFATFIPLWLITAVLRAMGQEVSPEEVELDYLEQDGLVACREVNLDPRILGNPCTYSWRFSHDLVNDCLKARIDRHKRRRQRIDWDAFVESAVSLVLSEAGSSLEAFMEGLAMWAALVTGRKEGILPLAKALSDAANDLGRNSEVNNGIFASIVGAGAWMMDELASLVDISDPSLFDAFCALGGVAARIIPPSLPFEVWGRIIRFGHLIARSGFASGRLPMHSMWEVPESTISSLVRIGIACTEQGTQHMFDATKDFDTRRRYIQLLMWAGRWNEAGRAVETAISDSIREYDPCLLLGWVNLAACAYLEAQDVQEARKAYERGVNLASSIPGMKSLANVFDMNAKLLSTWGNEGKKWPELMDEWHARLPDEPSEESVSMVAIIGNYPEHAAGSLIADELEAKGISSQLLYSEKLTNLGEIVNQLEKGDLSLEESLDVFFDELPHCGLVFLGGHLAHSIEELVHPVIHPEEYARMVVMESEPPAFGVLYFDVSSRPGVWIGGGNFRDTVSAVRYWLENGGVQRLVERL